MLRQMLEKCTFTFRNRNIFIRTCIIERKKLSDNVAANEQNYTPEETDCILQKLNSLKVDDLLCYNVTKIRANKLVAYKNRFGLLKSLDDIFAIDGFVPKVVNKLYRSLLEDPKEKTKTSRPRIASFLSPMIAVEHRDLIRSCVSLRVGVSSVTWARLELPDPALNSPCVLTDWQHYQVSEKKLHLQDLVQRCLYVDQNIPEADCYLFENPQVAQIMANPGSAEQKNVSIQKSQVEAMLSYAVNQRNYTADKAAVTKVFYLRRFLAARLFNHLIGAERVSSEETVLKMMRTHYNMSDAPDLVNEDVLDVSQTTGESQTTEESRTTGESQTTEETQTTGESQITGDIKIRREVLFSNDLRNMFARAERYHREFLGQALLLNLAFVRLILLQDPESLAVLTKQTNKNKQDLEIETQK